MFPLNPLENTKKSGQNRQKKALSTIPREREKQGQTERFTGAKPERIGSAKQTYIYLHREAPIASKLDPDQWAEIADLIADGTTLRAASKHALDVWGIKISKTQIGANKQVKRAMASRSQLRRIRAQEAISSSLLPVVKGLTKALESLYAERERVREVQAANPVISDAYERATKSLRTIDMTIRDHMKMYGNILDLGKSEVLGGSLDDSPDEIVKMIEDLRSKNRETDKRQSPQTQTTNPSTSTPEQTQTAKILSIAPKA